MGRFENRVALITGGGGAIGAAVARAYLAGGGRVVLVDHDRAALVRVAESMPQEGVHTIVADVTRGSDVAAYASEAKGIHGRVDFFFNNAGIEGPTAALVDYPEDAFQRVFAVNVTGVFLGMKYVLPVLEDGGSIVVTSSTAGLRGTPHLAAYTASKHAVVGLMRTAALESSARGIRVNTIHPAMVDSPMIERLEAARAKGRTLAEVRRRFEQTIPMGRYIAPEEVAELVAFLAGPESRMITGATYLVDGGAMLL